MLQKLVRSKFLQSFLIIMINIFIINIGQALGVNFFLPWTLYESHIVTQGNGGTFSHQGKVYYAWDFAMPEGTLIRASASGKILKVENSVPGYKMKSWGNYIVIDHGNGIYTRYAHLQMGSIFLSPGSRVKQGQVIGRSGNTGNSTGPHLHYQVENKDGFSIHSSFIEAGVPMNTQKVTSQNNGQESNSIPKKVKRVDYKRLYAILSSDEFKTQDNLTNTTNTSSPTENYLNNSLKNNTVYNDTFLTNLKSTFHKIFLLKDSYIILYFAFLNLPFLSLISSNYFLFKILIYINV